MTDKFGTKRNGIYGKGFTKMPFSEQKKRVDKAFTFEPPGRVVEQMDFLVATTHDNPDIVRIKNYAVEKEHQMEGKPNMITYQTDITHCPPGYVLVRAHKNKNGQYVQSYCRRKGAYASPELRPYLE